MTSVPQTPDGKHIAVAKLVGAGFKPSLVPQARCNAIASMRQAVAQAGGVFKQNRRPNSEVPEFGCGRWRIDPTSAGACLRCLGLPLALPGERMLDNGWEAGEPRLQFQHRPRAIGGRNDLRGIARAPPGELHLEILAGHALDGFDHFEHGEAAAIPAIERDRLPPRAQIEQRIPMRARESPNVKLVAE